MARHISAEGVRELLAELELAELESLKQLTGDRKAENYDNDNRMDKAAGLGSATKDTN